MKFFNGEESPISLVAWILQSHFNPKDFSDVSRIDQQRKSLLEILQSQGYLYCDFLQTHSIPFIFASQSQYFYIFYLLNVKQEEIIFTGRLNQY